MVIAVFALAVLYTVYQTSQNKHGSAAGGGDMRDGHSFVLVCPDGKIGWRADYGGAPDFTMFLPTQKMLTDLTKERTA